MNVFGIDYQSDHCTIGLREVSGDYADMRPVGDGKRSLIPLAAVGDTWGSKALAAALPDNLAGPAPGAPGPWLDGSGPERFWRGLFEHFYSYLGRVAPVEENGYRVVVALPTRQFSGALTRLNKLAWQAGFSMVAGVLPTDALLCRWLAERGPGRPVRRVAAVAVGDDSVIVRAYEINEGTTPIIIAAASSPQFLPDAGLTIWVKNLTRLLSERLGTPIPAEMLPAVHDAAVEMGARLAQSGDLQPLAWRGPFRSQMLAPLVLTRNACRSWKEAIILTSHLPRVICDALGGTSTPDVVLWGGMGAGWPCGFEALERVVSPDRIWCSGSPLHDIAYGAAYWPKYGQPNTQAIAWDEAAPAEPCKSVPVAAAPAERPVESPVSTTSPEDQIPPWLRGKQVNDDPW